MSTLSILAWNIWMMPPWALQSPKNHARAEAVAAELLRVDADILCLAKAFDPGARRVIGAALAKRYPHQTPVLNEEGSPLVINGGVWVLSRLPLGDRKEICFDAAAGVEKLSRKGAMFVRGRVGESEFQLVATHQQGDDRPTYNPDHQRIRDQQTAEIAAAFRGWGRQGVPTFYCGDFSTPRREAPDSPEETPAYRSMLTTLGARNGPGERITLDDRRAVNDLAEGDTGRRAEMDYILVDDAQIAREGRLSPPLQGAWERVVLRHAGWDAPGGRRDLSYRYAVRARFQFPEAE